MNARRERPRLLLIEDHREMRHMLARLFGLSGWDVAECRDLAEGYAHLATHYGAYDAAVIDLYLPDGSGAEIVRDIRAVHGARRIVVHTAADRAPGPLRAVLDSGAHAVVFKPASFVDVLLPVVLGTYPLTGVPFDPDAVTFA